MNWRQTAVVYRKELTDSLRDRRTILSMIVIPVLVMPLLMFGFGGAAVRIISKAQQEIPEIMVIGGQDSPKISTALKELKTIKIVPAVEDFTARIENKTLRAAVEIPRGFDAALAGGDSKTVLIYHYAGEIKSQLGADRLEKFFRDYRLDTVKARLAARNLPENLVRPFEITQQNVVSAKKVSGNVIGGILPYMIILLCMSGAMYPAMDLTAGEKERGTIETLLCSPVARTNLVLGKFLTVLTISLATAMLSLSSMAVSFHFAKGALLGMPAKQAALLGLTLDAKSAFCFLAMVFPLAVLFSAAQLAIALFAKSFREAQTYLAPLMIVVIVPAVAGMLPGVELNLKLALVPILNTSLVCKEIFTGIYHWDFIALIFASSCVYAAVALAAAVRLFQREDVLFRA